MSNAALPAITESLDQLQSQLRATRDRAHRERLRALILLQSQQADSRREVADRLERHRNTIGRWFQTYQDGGLDALLERKPIGRPPGQSTLPPPVVEALTRALDSETGFASYGAVQRWLHDEFGLEIPYPTVYKLVRYDLKAKLKRPRPRHEKKA